MFVTHPPPTLRWLPNVNIGKLSSHIHDYCVMKRVNFTALYSSVAKRDSSVAKRARNRCIDVVLSCNAPYAQDTVDIVKKWKKYIF